MSPDLVSILFPDAFTECASRLDVLQPLAAGLKEPRLERQSRFGRKAWNAASAAIYRENLRKYRLTNEVNHAVD